MLRLILALVALHFGCCAYTENLYIRPLTRGNVLATFDFEISQKTPANLMQHRSDSADLEVDSYTLFPRSLGQIMGQSNTRELHLRFGQGWWDADEWNSPPAGGDLAGGIGVELWAWIAGDSHEEAWNNWRQLTHSLGGYFCASVNFIDETVTSFPSENIHKPWGNQSTSADQLTSADQSTSGSSKTWLMRGALPAEPICTENLTPFLKLLPCRGKAGISSLLDGHTLFKSRWQTMSVDAWHSANGEEISLKQTVSNVLNTAISIDQALPFAAAKEDLVCDYTKPWSNEWVCFPVFPKTANYSLSSIFGAQVRGKCPISSSSNIVVDAPPNWQVNGQSDVRQYNLNTLFSDSGSDDATASDLVSNGELDIQFYTEDSATVHNSSTPSLYLDRSFSGWGQQRGGIRTVFTNRENYALEVSYLESLPWFMRVYLHTTQLSGDGEVVSRSYTPSKDRGRPTQLETVILLPPGARFEIEYAFDKSLLFIEEYPPDANHGFEVPPGLAVARPALREAKPAGHKRYEVRTASLLLSLPVPDFSMPYNVIILTSTVMAMAFATLFNLMSREVISEDMLKPRVSPISKLKEKSLKILGGN